MRKFVYLGMLLVLALAFSVALGPGGSDASSHREAPAISQDPAADLTDVYAFRSPDNPDTVTFISNVYPGEIAYGGPNFYRFADDVVYQINVDNNGDAQEDIAYQFTFRTQNGNPANPFNSGTFLYNTGPITSLDDADYNFRQFMTVTRINYYTVGNRRYGTPTVLGSNLLLPPSNVGKVSLPDYEAVAMQAVYSLPGGMKVFAGQRDDPFFVDLGAVFDLLQVRNPGEDALEEANVHSIAIQVPISQLVGDASGVIGTWSTTSRATTRVFGGYSKGDEWYTEDAALDAGNAYVSPLRQVSRLGMPLVNEVVIAVRDKDRFNASHPSTDTQFLSYVTNSHLAAVVNTVYPNTFNCPVANRSDLVTAFLTGVPGLNQPTNVRASEMLRLNTTTPATAIAADGMSAGNRLAVLGGDTGGFPNGRRLTDDVVDIALRVVCGALTGNATQLGDGVDHNDMPFKTTFPYLATPHSAHP